MKELTETEKLELLKHEIDPWMGRSFPGWAVYFYDDSDELDPKITSSLPEIEKVFESELTKR